MFRNIIIGAGLLAALITVVIFSGKSSTGGVTGPSGQVNVWGTVPYDQVDSFLQLYNPQAKTYTLNYIEIPEKDFNDKLVNALANGNGPDLIIAPYQIIISQIARIQPFPLTSLPEKTYRDSFVDGTGIFWTPYGAMALPLSIEPLMLFYNRTLLSKAGIAGPPSYWGDLMSMIPKLTSFDQKGNFVDMAIPLGTFDNIPYSKDMIMTLVYQLKQIPVTVNYTSSGLNYTVTLDEPVDTNKDVKPFTTAIKFWTEFANQSKTIYTWNNFIQDPQSLFLGEKLAMYIGYSGEYNKLRTANQKLDLGMTSFPQAKDYNTFSTGMRLYGVAVLKTSKNINTAITAASSLTTTYSKEVADMIGGTSPAKAIVVGSNLDADLVKSILNARGFYDIFEKQTTSLLSTMINDILTGRMLTIDAVSNFVSKFDRLYSNLR